MKALFILAAALLTTSVLADEVTVKPDRIEATAKAKVHIKIDDIKGEATERTVTNTGDENTGGKSSKVKIPAMDAKDNLMLKKNIKSNTKAQDYNSSRSNRRGVRDAASGLPTGKRKSKSVVPCYATDNDCDDKDPEARAPTSSGSKTTTKSKGKKGYDHYSTRKNNGNK